MDVGDKEQMKNKEEEAPRTKQWYSRFQMGRGEEKAGL